MILKVQDLNVHYGVIHALKGVNIEVEEGQIVSLIGSNGAGKTSLLRTISGLIKASSGSIHYMDQEIVNPKHPELLPSTGLVQVPEGRKIFAGMSVYENLLMGASSNLFSISSIKMIRALRATFISKDAD